MSLTRRRFLTIASAACLAAPSAQAFRWQGVALGARAQIVLDHPRAIQIAQAAMAEIDRLEDVFSLFRAGSELMRLNAAGRLASPSRDLLECLATARRVHDATEGRFDPTVQPIWQLLAEAYARGAVPEAEELAQARASIGFDRVAFDSAAVVLGAGQRLTLNGIAQGYVADRVAGLMRAEGVADVLIDTGEIIAMGAPREADGWPVTIAGEADARLLSGRALATSARFGTILDPGGRVGHILDPRHGGTVGPAIRQISVSASSAALADGLSTGLCLVDSRTEAERLLSKVKDVRLESLYA